MNRLHSATAAGTLWRNRRRTYPAWRKREKQIFWRLYLVGFTDGRRYGIKEAKKLIQSPIGRWSL